MQIGHRILRKRIHVRIEHVAPSRCREEFLVRQKKNDQIKHEAKERGGRAPCCHDLLKAGAAYLRNKATCVPKVEATAEGNPSLAHDQMWLHVLIWEYR